MEYFDISPIISEQSAVFPGDQPFSRSIALSFSQGKNLELSSVNTSLHIGAHADAPSHYAAAGVGIEARDLRHYVGRCQVVDVSEIMLKKSDLPDKDFLIHVDDFANTPIECRRILFKTQTFKDGKAWSDHFAAFHKDVTTHLARLGVRLLGIDTPSIDPAQSQDLPSHKEIFKNDMAILEGLDLSMVPAGLYTLLALPLRIEAGDASPVRAVLFKPDVDISRM